MHTHAPSGRSPAVAIARRLCDRCPTLLRAAGARLGTWIALERERIVLWLPVSFGAGILIYFALPREPAAIFAPAALLSAALIAAAPLLWPRLRPLALPFLLLACLPAGLAAGKLRSDFVAAPVFARPGTFTLEGRVRLVEPRGERMRLLLDGLRVADLAAERTPARVRVTVPAREDVVPGAGVRLRARLLPPSGPSWPRGYDLARREWFEGVGGIGWSLGEVALLEPPAAAGLADHIAALRRDIALEARSRIGGEAGGVAAALLTGLRGDIPDRVWSDMQASGLAHLLAISGLHLGLVAGAVFFAARLLFAAIPPLALRIPARKPAAVAALAASFGYLLLAGAPVPTRRAFVMIAVALFAVVIDRNPFSMRLVAVAAAVVLALQPESVVSVSFQMSFAAVVALIAWFERRTEAPDPDAAPAPSGLPDRLRHYLLLVVTTTLLASLATLPFAAYHFQRVAAWGVLANLIAVPLTAFWIMPAGLVGLALHSVGLAGPAFDLMGTGVALLLAVARTVSGLPGASVLLPAWPDAALALFVAGGLWLAIWQQPWRFAALPVLAVAIALGLLARPPDLLASPELDQLALRTADGGMVLRERVRDAFLRRQWQAAMLARDVVPPPVHATAGATVACDALGCVLDGGPGARIAVVFLAGALAEDCRRADLVITALRVRRCQGPARLVDGAELRRSGGLAIWLEDDGYRIETVAGARGDRPWTGGGR